MSAAALTARAFLYDHPPAADEPTFDDSAEPAADDPAARADRTDAHGAQTDLPRAAVVALAPEGERKRALEALLRARRLQRDAPPLRGEDRRLRPLRHGHPGARRAHRRRLPRGQLSQVHGPASSGRTGVLVVAPRRRSRRRGALAALVDPLDRFDPASAAAAGVDLARLLWLRGPRGDSEEPSARRRSPTPRPRWRRSPARGSSTSWPSTSPAPDAALVALAPVHHVAASRAPRRGDADGARRARRRPGRAAAPEARRSRSSRPARAGRRRPAPAARLVLARRARARRPPRPARRAVSRSPPRPDRRRGAPCSADCTLPVPSPDEDALVEIARVVHAARRAARARPPSCSTSPASAGCGRRPTRSAARSSTRPPRARSRPRSRSPTRAHAALVLARARARASRSCPPAARRHALAPLPLALLGVSPEREDVLGRWGLRTIGDLARLPAHGPRRALRSGRPAARAARARRGRGRPAARGAAGAVRDDARARLAGGRPRAARVPARRACSSRCARPSPSAGARPRRSTLDARPRRRQRPRAPARAGRALGRGAHLAHARAARPRGAPAARRDPSGSPRAPSRPPRAPSQFSLLDPALPSPERLAETMARLVAWTADGRGGRAAARRHAPAGRVRDRRRSRPGRWRVGDRATRRRPGRASPCARSGPRASRSVALQAGGARVRVRARRARCGGGARGPVARVGRLVGRRVEPRRVGRRARRPAASTGSSSTACASRWYVEGELD